MMDPIEWLLRIHNDGEDLPTPPKPELLVATCMDSRIQLRMPPGSAFILRAAGADVRAAEFDIAVAVALRGVRAIALVTHTDCAMATATTVRDPLVEGLVRVGWTADEAGKLFEQHARAREIGDEHAFARSEAERVAARYPSLTVAALVYDVADGRLARAD